MPAGWLNLSEIVGVHAARRGDELAVKDARRALSYRELDARASRMANVLRSELGLRTGERLAVLLENSADFVELYVATARAGVVIVPINIRLTPAEVVRILKDSGARTLITEDEFIPALDGVPGLERLAPRRIALGEAPRGSFEPWEPLVAAQPARDPGIDLAPADPWVILYTSGTTGVPKGVVRSHESYVAFWLINCVDFGYQQRDRCLNVMPLCHVNTTFFTFCFTYVGAAVYVHPARSFEPEEILEIIAREKVSFVSLVPTHYNLLLNVPAERRADVSSVRKLLCSSAPATRDMKLAVRKFFPGVELYEGYGSTEAGIVTVLKPWEQLEKLGSIGRESTGTHLIRLLDEHAAPVPQGTVGELYSKGPMLFDRYHGMPERTNESFVDGYFSAGDMARQDEDGYFYLVDRKNNMIITGGENVYPSEVEELVMKHPAVFEAAVVGLPHPKWGESVTAVVVRRAAVAATEDEIVAFCRGRIASYKRPKAVVFFEPDEMPKTATGKILRRIVRERLSAATTRR